MASPELRPAQDPSAARDARERRGQSRLEVVQRCLVPVKLGQQNGGIALDLSAGGMTVQAIAPLAAGQRYRIELQLPSGEVPISGWAEVVSSRHKVAGLRVEFLPESQSRMQRWLEANGSPAAKSTPSTPPLPVATPSVANLQTVHVRKLPQPAVAKSTPSTLPLPAATPTLAKLQSLPVPPLPLPPVFKRRTKAYAAMVVGAIVSGAIALGFAVYGSARHAAPAHTAPALTAIRQFQPATLSPARVSIPPNAPASHQAVQRLGGGAPRVTAGPLANLRKPPRKQVRSEEADQPEVIVRRFVNGRWVVVSRKRH
jgi:hypothetical protein